MLATAMMHDVHERPPGLAGPPLLFQHPQMGRQPLFGMPPPSVVSTYDNGSLIGGPMHLPRPIDGQGPRHSDVYGRQGQGFVRPQQRRQQQPAGRVPLFAQPGAMVNNQLTGPSNQQLSLGVGQMTRPLSASKRKRQAWNKKQRRLDAAGPAVQQQQPGRVEGDFVQPRLRDLRKLNRKGARKFFSRPPRPNKQKDLTVPKAPQNTTSFLMRASKGSPSTPPLLRTPSLSSSPWPSGTAGEQLLEAAKELRVDPYGSMNGCIRLGSPEADGSGDAEVAVDKDEPSSGQSEATTSSDSIDHDREVHDAQVDSIQHVGDDGPRRFEMLYSADGMDLVGGKNGDSFLRARIEEQESHIAHLEDENLTLREKLYVAEQELKELRRRAGEGSDDIADAEGHWSGGEEASCAAAASPSASIGH